MNKPRLIDANALLRDLALEPMENRTYWRANEIVLDQPTAYDIDKVTSYIDRVANSGLGKSKSLEYIKKYMKAVENEYTSNICRLLERKVDDGGTTDADEE